MFMNNKERVFIIIDGSNFYHRLKEARLLKLLNFDYAEFAKLLAGDRDIVLSKYYIGAIREEEGNLKSKTFMGNQRKLVGKLKKYGWKVEFGHMLKIDGYHEKGVDVWMAVDILIGAYENLYDSVILVSSDTDLLPAISKARLMKKKVEYVGFSHKPSMALIANSDERMLLRKNDLERFLPDNAQKSNNSVLHIYFTLNLSRSSMSSMRIFFTNSGTWETRTIAPSYLSNAFAMTGKWRKFM